MPLPPPLLLSLSPFTCVVVRAGTALTMVAFLSPANSTTSIDGIKGHLVALFVFIFGQFEEKVEGVLLLVEQLIALTSSNVEEETDADDAVDAVDDVDGVDGNPLIGRY